jgi:hypothetical protein
MNDTQWTYELWAMNKADEERLQESKFLMDNVKESVVNMLGLNLMPVEDAQTKLLRRPREDEYIPLMLGLGREELVGAVLEARQQLHIQEQVQAQIEREGGTVGPSPSSSAVVEMSPEELESFMRDGDIEFENTPEEIAKALSWGTRETQLVLENLVLAKEDVDSGDPLEQRPARTIGQARKDLIIKSRDTGPRPEMIQVKIRSEAAAEGDFEKTDRLRVVLKTDR